MWSPRPAGFTPGVQVEPLVINNRKARVQKPDAFCFCCGCSFSSSCCCCFVWTIFAIEVALIALILIWRWLGGGGFPVPPWGVPGYNGDAPMLEYPYGGLDVPIYDMYPPFMVSAVWGMDSCVGVTDTSAEWARQNGCVAVLEDTNGDGVGDGDLITRTISRTQVNVLFSSSSAQPGWQDSAQFPVDAVAVKFSWPVEPDSLQWDDIDVILTDGRRVKPDTVSLQPANDPNERCTVTVYGEFANHSAGDNGNWAQGELTTPGMAAVEVVSELIVTNGTHRFDVNGARFRGGNLNFEKGAVLTNALLRDYDPSVNPIGEGRQGTTCRQYDGVTHVLQAVTNGGVTKDGVNSFNDDQVGLFSVTLRNGGDLRRSAFVGLADIDGDDFTDICLRLEPGEVEALGSLTMHCDESDPLQRSALPHGNEQGFSPCTDTQPQPISHLRCPESPYCR